MSAPIPRLERLLRSASASALYLEARRLDDPESGYAVLAPEEREKYAAALRAQARAVRTWKKSRSSDRR